MGRLILAFALSLLATPVMAQGVLSDSRALSPQTYIPFLNHYLPRLPDIRATMKACYPADVPATEPEEWEKAKAVITATLWAADFPSDVAQSPEWLMHPDVVGVASDCGPVGMTDAAQQAASAGWVQFVGFTFKAIGIEMIENPLPPESLTEIEAIVTEETALTERLIACASVTAPGLLLLAAVDWNERLVGVLAKLARLGYPRPALLALAEAGNPDAFLDVENVDEMITSCQKDTAWYERVAMFNMGSLTGRIDDLLERTGVVAQ